MAAHDGTSDFAARPAPQGRGIVKGQRARFDDAATAQRGAATGVGG